LALPLGSLSTFGIAYGSRIAAITINTDSLIRCIHTLEEAFTQLQKFEVGHSFYDIFQAASVKEFELVLEQSGRLLRKRLHPFFASNRQVDHLTFKDAFRHAVRHDLISAAACERWFAYREHRNDTAHEYGERFAEATLELLPDFISDAKELAHIIAEGRDD